MRLAPLLLLLACMRPQPTGFLKGQTHAHTSNSGDGRTPPADVLRWYGEHGFDFVVFTDHNVVTQEPGGKVLAIPGVELTQNLETCEGPAPEKGNGCLLHVNALFVDPARTMALPPPEGMSRVQLFDRALKATAGMRGLAQVNHPNFQYAANAEVLAELAKRGATFLEIANDAIDSNNAGDATHPDTEALWDAVLSKGLTLYGVASDDAHHFYDAATARPAYVGDRGFVMVRAAKDPKAIRDAMARGDFYASTGLLLTALTVGADGLTLEAGEDVDFRCIGTGGQVLATTHGRKARCAKPATGYVRAVAENARGQKAWSQPVR